MKYEVIYGKDLPALEEAVNEKLRIGWKPLGGVAMSEGHYLQAMIRDESYPYQGY
jgi:hypothetical protein